MTDTKSSPDTMLLSPWDLTARNPPGVRVPDGMDIRDAVRELAAMGATASPDCMDHDSAKLAAHLASHYPARVVSGAPGAASPHDPLRGRCGELTEALVAADASLVHVVGWVIYPHPDGTRRIWAHEWAETPEGGVVDPVWGDAGPLEYLGCPLAAERELLGHGDEE